MHDITRREFMERSATAAAALTVVPVGQAAATVTPAPRKRVVLVGTGSRGTTMWGNELVHPFKDFVEMVGLCDINKKRVEVGKRHISIEAPTFTDFDQMIKATRPDTVIVTTKDSTHDQYIIRAMELGCDVITEKPMTTDEKKCQAILDAEKKYGKKLIVGFNLRYFAVSEKTKEILQSGVIGKITSVDFHWYLNTSHGADYYRRWHAYKRNSGSLWVHKATHHFDLINWLLEAEPVEVNAFGDLKHYGRNGKFRAKNCRECTHKSECKFYFDVTKNQKTKELYVDCESEDNYYRDACLFREDIDIYDTMTATMKYSNGVLMSYSLNTFMPYEGYHLAFNGMEGRLDVRTYESQPWPQENAAEYRITKLFGSSETGFITANAANHYGADPKLKQMLFHPEMPDPLKQRAGSRAGAMSLLTGVAAVRSIEQGRPIKIADLVKF